jgi:hypothetical protein
MAKKNSRAENKYKYSINKRDCLTTNGENPGHRSGFRIGNLREIKIYNCCQIM